MANAERQDGGRTPRRRGERLETRITAEQKALITRAAALEGRSLTDFVLSSVQDAAKRTIAEHAMIELSARDSRAFVEALLQPREPSQPMRKRVTAFKTRMGDSKP
ncbi:DUF1778 domain-containing protein [Methylobacterium sp. E-005]|uniref:type II toxin-antitoxin system TacA family antitoxin n=1 Tax=Methylobacterium sp. E-005 TaxID=2836549 RepID=UPI001FBB0E05|nr:DUF1778 domain-containing protein [Methylobacterium sp. E-005]MCJ2089948.1 DUF1778 domain-containing protein [Methylobacterium sp. E-005]